LQREIVAMGYQAGLWLDAVTANAEVRRWQNKIANQRLHGTTSIKPANRLLEEQSHLQGLRTPWRGDIAAAPPQTAPAAIEPPAARPASVIERIETPTPAQHPLAVYAHLLTQRQQETAVAA
jgi:hypothetical protein